VVARVRLLRLAVDVTDYQHAAQEVVERVARKNWAYVCAANVHMLMEAYDDPEFRAVVSAAALVTPDGMPLVWLLKRLGARSATRVYGPDLMLAVCALAVEKGVKIGLYGGHERALLPLQAYLLKHYPGLKLTYAFAPPFQRLNEKTQQDIRRKITSAGVQILFVGLGCPKQERWMHQQLPELSCMMLGVGAAFDFHSGRVQQAPTWIQRLGLEWFFRLIQEPQRLWRRYFWHNTRFVILALIQLWQTPRINAGDD